MSVFLTHEIEETGWHQPVDQELTGLLALQNVGTLDMWITATTDASVPPADAPAFNFRAGFQPYVGYTLQDFFGGLGAPVRLWVKGPMKSRIVISHA